MKDPIGTAIEDFYNGELNAEIIVESDLCDDDTIPLSILCRSFEEMSDLEKIALNKASGEILDVGAGCGNHALELTKKGSNVTAIDISEKAVQHMINKGINAHNIRMKSFVLFRSSLLQFFSLSLLAIRLMWPS